MAWACSINDLFLLLSATRVVLTVSRGNGAVELFHRDSAQRAQVDWVAPADCAVTRSEAVHGCSRVHVVRGSCKYPACDTCLARDAAGYYLYFSRICAVAPGGAYRRECFPGCYPAQCCLQTHARSQAAAPSNPDASTELETSEFQAWIFVDSGWLSRPILKVNYNSTPPPLCVFLYLNHVYIHYFH